MLSEGLCLGFLLLSMLLYFGIPGNNFWFLVCFDLVFVYWWSLISLLIDRVG
jgi:hypothetical protein